MKRKVLIIYTGGTIGMEKDYETGSLRAFDFNHIFNKIPEMNLLECEISVHQFSEPLDSSDVGPEEWKEIAKLIESNYKNFDGFLILHGTDTMAYTSSALSFMLNNLKKPVILTGSQLPIGDLRTDAKENLITAIQIASLQVKNKPVIQEVGLYFEYKLYRGNRTTKINAEHFNAFTSPNYPALAESGVHLKVEHHLFFSQKTSKKLIVHKKLDDHVFVLKLFPGLNESVLKSIINIPNLKGIVIETYGAGNAPTDEWFIKTLEEAVNKGIHIINVTQCSGGSVNMGQYETSTALKKLGIISGKDITTEAAITKLMYLLSQNVSHTSFKTIFETSLRGELF